MKIHTTNYQDTFIAIAEDCPAVTGEAPPAKGEKRSVAALQFELLHQHPYKYTSDEVLFRVHAIRNDLTPQEEQAARETFFSKGQPCLRASPLTKRYGWGVHADARGKVAIYGCETRAYQDFIANPALRKVNAMRSAR